MCFFSLFLSFARCSCLLSALTCRMHGACLDVFAQGYPMVDFLVRETKFICEGDLAIIRCVHRECTLFVFHSRISSDPATGI